MELIYSGVIRHRKLFILLFALSAIICAFLSQLVAVNYDMQDYLPETAASTVSMETMKSEFEGGIPNARIMIRDVTIPEALEYKQQLKEIDGVAAVTWLDDSVYIQTPTSMMDKALLETYYKDNCALFSVTLEQDKRISGTNDIRKLLGDRGALSGSAISTAYATITTETEVQKIAGVSVLFVLLVLTITTESWIAPFLVLTGIGVSVLINRGTNLIYGEISFVTNAAGSLLLLAVSLDYSVFLIHRFSECRAECSSPDEAMLMALCRSTSSIISSGLTTVIGFLALVLMEFRLGADLGLALSKGIAISLLTVFFFMPPLILLTCPLMDKTAHRSFVPDLTGLGKLVRAISVPFVVLFIVVVLPSYLASNSNSFYYGSSHIFGDGTDYGRDTDAIQEIFGQNDDYVLMVPKGDTATEKALSDALHTIPEITSIISYVDRAGAEIPKEYLDADTLSLLESDSYSRMVLSVDTAYEGDETFSLVEQVRATAEAYYPGSYYLAGEGVSTYDLMSTVTQDMLKVNLIAIGAVFMILLLTMRSLVTPAILVLSIETAIWVNLSVPYFSGHPIFYIAYLIISSIQLGATVDYAILMTDRYKENRETHEKKDAIVKTISDVTASILTSGSATVICGYLMNFLSTNQLLAQLGVFIGRGALCSLFIVLFVLPGLLAAFDRLVVKKTTRRHAK